MSDNKIKVFWATDSPTVGTGFGRVSNELISRLLKTGRYQIICMGTNDRGEHHPLRGAKDLIIEPLPYVAEDPYGMHAMPELLKKYRPDVIFSLNDLFVWTGDERSGPNVNWFLKALKQYKPYVPWVAYFPIDGRPLDQLWVSLINQMTFAVSFCDYGEKVLKETPNVDMTKVRKIYHGSAHDKFFPCDEKERLRVRHEMRVPDDAFLIGMVSRNQPRKQIPRAIQIFKMFNDGYVHCSACGYPRNPTVTLDCEICGAYEHENPVAGVDDVYLYLHMNLLDLRGYRLPKIMKDNKLRNFVTNPNHSISHGVPVEELNHIYNALDLMLHPASAGGYELPPVESQAAGTPVMACRNTSITEHLEDNKGYMVLPESYLVYEDATHCPKYLMSIPESLKVLREAYDDYKNDTERRRDIIQNGIEYAHSRTWDTAAAQFDKLLQQAVKTKLQIGEIADKSDKEQKLLIVNTEYHFGKTLSMLPAIKSLAKANKQMDIMLGVNSRIFPLIENLDYCRPFKIEKLWLEDEDFQKRRIMLRDVSQAVNMFQDTAKMLNGFDKSWADVYASLMRVNLEDKTIPYEVTEDEKKWARSLLKGHCGEHDIKVLIIAESEHPNTGIADEEWAKFISLAKKFKDVKTIVISSEEHLDIIGGDVQLHALTLRELFAIAYVSDCIITNHDEYMHLANIFDLPTIIVATHADFSYNFKHNKKVSYVRKDSVFPCAPCFKDANQPCVANGTHRAQCMVDTKAHEIFSQLLFVRSSYFKQKTEKAKKQQSRKKRQIKAASKTKQRTNTKGKNTKGKKKNRSTQKQKTTKDAIKQDELVTTKT